MKRKLISAVVATALLSALSLGAPAVAQAAVGSCTTTKTVTETQFSAVVPSTSSGNRDCAMSQGAVGNHVRALQTALNACYAGGLTVDGVFGAATKAALKKAQLWMGITQDGVYGSQTNHAINWRDNTGHCWNFPFAW